MNEPAYRAFGPAQRSPGAKVEALAEAIDILRGLWSTSDFSYTGQHFGTEEPPSNRNLAPRSPSGSECSVTA